MSDDSGVPLISVLIVSFNTRELTLAAVRSVHDTLEAGSFEVIVVDNASTDGSADTVAEVFQDAVVIALDENLGFGRANNRAMAQSRGRYLLLLNSDARLTGPGGAVPLIQRMKQEPDLGCVAPRLQSENGTLECSARAFPTVSRELARRTGLYRLLPGGVRGRWLLGSFWSHDERRDVDWLTGACLLVRREVVEQVRGFDPAIFMYGEELEWCYRIKSAGWRLAYDPAAVVVHRRGASSGREKSWRVLRAMEGDLHMLRTHRGRIYTTVFAKARSVALALELLLFSVWGFLHPSGYRRSRRDGAALEARCWRAVLRKESSCG